MPHGYREAQYPYHPRVHIAAGNSISQLDHQVHNLDLNIQYKDYGSNLMFVGHDLAAEIAAAQHVQVGSP